MTLEELQSLGVNDFVIYTGVRKEVKWFCRVVSIYHHSDPNDNKYTLAGYDMTEGNPGLGCRDTTVDVNVAIMLSDRVEMANSDSCRIKQFMEYTRSKCKGLEKALEFWCRVGRDLYEKAMAKRTE